MLPYNSDMEIEYMEQHAPTCIKKNHKPPLKELKEVVINNCGENSTCFGLACECGNDEFELYLPEETGIVNAKCVHCDATVELFNPKIHGYEGALGEADYLDINEEASEFICKNCGNNCVVIASGFQYSGETDVLEEEDLDIQPEDLFGYYVISTKCNKCENTALAFEHECA